AGFGRSLGRDCGARGQGRGLTASRRRPHRLAATESPRSKVALESGACDRFHLLDTHRGRHYVAPDFEGMNFLFVPGRKRGDAMSEPDDERPESGAAGHRATADLEARIARARGRSSAETGAAPVRAQNTSGALTLGWRLGSEFVAAIIVGAGLGYLLDMFL